MRHDARRLTAVLLVFLAALTSAFAVAAPAQAAPADCEYPANACEGPTLAVSTTVPDPGETITGTGAKFLGDRDITLVLNPARKTTSYQSFAPRRSFTLGTVRSNATGGFETPLTIPKTARGAYDLVAHNGTPRGYTDPSVRLNVGAGSTDRDENRSPNNDQPATAFTGFNMLWLLLLAAALLTVGIYLARRGRNRDPIRSIHG